MKKTEAIICSSKASKLKVSLDSIHSDSSPRHCQRFRVFFDKNLLMTNHMNSVVYCKAVWTIYVSTWTEKLQMQLLCHASCQGWTTATVVCGACQKNQLLRQPRVQNTAARLVTQTKRSDYVTPIFRMLHWLPVEMHIDYKILSLVYSCMNGTFCPPSPPPPPVPSGTNISLPSSVSSAVLHPISSSHP